VGGLRYAFDPEQPVGSRIVSVEVQNEDGSYTALDLNAVYQLASNDFMRNGGDDYTMFATNAIDPYDAGAVLADAVAEYIGANSPVSPSVEGRITVKEAPPELPTSGGIPAEAALPGVAIVVGLLLVASGLYVRRQERNAAL
jgi:5'-nucleotidase